MTLEDLPEILRGVLGNWRGLGGEDLRCTWKCPSSYKLEQSG